MRREIANAVDGSGLWASWTMMSAASTSAVATTFTPPVAESRTSAFALNNATLPFALKIANLGAEEAMRQNPHLANGLNVSGGKIRHEAVAEALGLAYEPA